MKKKLKLHSFFSLSLALRLNEAVGQSGIVPLEFFHFSIIRLSFEFNFRNYCVGVGDGIEIPLIEAIFFFHFLWKANLVLRDRKIVSKKSDCKSYSDCVRVASMDRVAMGCVRDIVSRELNASSLIAGAWEGQRKSKIGTDSHENYYVNSLCVRVCVRVKQSQSTWISIQSISRLNDT